MRITQYKSLLSNDRTASLVKERSVNYPLMDTLQSPNAICRMFRELYALDQQTEEYVYLLCMDKKCHLIGLFEISHGSIDHAFCDMRSIFQKVVLCNSSDIILVHNHPSGSAQPSKEDISVSKKLKSACELMDVGLLDFIIYAGDDFCSFKENNMLR